MVHNNLGLIYDQRDELTKAEAEYKKELVLNPNWDKVHFNYGLLLLRMGKGQEAEAMFLRTVEINPEHNQARRALQYLHQNP